MPSNAVLALFYVLSENSMAFSRPEHLATMRGISLVFSFDNYYTDFFKKHNVCSI